MKFVYSIFYRWKKCIWFDGQNNVNSYPHPALTLPTL